MVSVFLVTEKSLNKTWHLGLLYTLSELKLSMSLIRLISSFLSQRKFRVSVEGEEMSMPRDIQAGLPQGSTLSTHCTIYIFVYIYIYINVTPQHGVSL
jgi:hypothetical protein